MKRIKTHTIGWDTTKKEGYVTLTDEDDKDDAFHHLTLEEVSLLQKLLSQEPVYLDTQQWIITGWEKNQLSVSKNALKIHN